MTVSRMPAVLATLIALVMVPVPPAVMALIALNSRLVMTATTMLAAAVMLIVLEPVLAQFVETAKPALS